MTLFENPILLSREAERLERAIHRYQARLLAGDFEPTGPFLGRPELSCRHAFGEIREARLPEELRRSWLRWSFRFADARVNGPLDAAIAEAYRGERHLVEWDETRSYTLRELFFGVLLEGGKRQRFLDTLATKSGSLGRLVTESFTRRVELSHRAGFQHPDELEAPCEDLESFARELLAATHDLGRQLVPAELESLLEAAHGEVTSSCWPPQLNPRTLRGLLGSDEWFKGLSLRVMRLPLALSPASYCRALARVGASLVDASAPASQPFVVARDPYGLERRIAGALFGSLPTLDVFCRLRLGLSRTNADAQARSLVRSGLLHVRIQALAVVLRAKAYRGRSELLRDYEELTHDTFGFALPRSLAGLLPRLHPDGGQRLLASCLVPAQTANLVAEFDEDWFRNPRGIEAVRARMTQVPRTTVTRDVAAEAAHEYASYVATRLG